MNPNKKVKYFDVDIQHTNISTLSQSLNNILEGHYETDRIGNKVKPLRLIVEGDIYNRSTSTLHTQLFYFQTRWPTNKLTIWVIQVAGACNLTDAEILQEFLYGEDPIDFNAFYDLHNATSINPTPEKRPIFYVLAKKTLSVDPIDCTITAGVNDFSQAVKNYPGQCSISEKFYFDIDLSSRPSMLYSDISIGGSNTMDQRTILLMTQDNLKDKTTSADLINRYSIQAYSRLLFQDC